MSPETVQAWIDINPTLMPWVLSLAALIISVLVYFVARFLIGRGLVYLSGRTETKYDDILVQQLRPFRFAWIAPLLIIVYFADLVPAGTEVIRQIALFAILWLVVMTVNCILTAINTIYESSHLYHGESIQGYLDLAKVVVILAAIVISISLLTGESPLVLLSGLGVVMGLILLVFRDTIMSFVASVQINSSDLIMEGDSIEMPSFNADGSVVNISLHSVKVQNWDKSISIIPTYKFLDTPYRNWRGMLESGARRIKRSIRIDLNSVAFCDRALMEYFRSIDLIGDYIEAELARRPRDEKPANWSPENPFDEPFPTNIEIFQVYASRFLMNRTDIHQEGMTLLVRQKEPGPDGLPLEIYAYTKTVDLADFESIQAQIINHLIAAMPQFGLQVFQQPTGLDFAELARVRPGVG